MKEVTMSIQEFYTYYNNHKKENTSNIKSRLGTIKTKFCSISATPLVYLATTPLIDFSRPGYTEPLPGEEGSTLVESIEKIAEVCNYLLHPSLIVKAIWTSTVASSYYVCTLLALFGIVCWWFGVKKYSKLVPVSVFSYIFIQYLNQQLVASGFIE